MASPSKSKRNHRSAKKAGTALERDVADYLAARLNDDRIERRARNGVKDRGDISGLKHMGGRIVVEVKNYGGRLLPAAWLAEAETERGNDDAIAGVVVAKRKGTTRPGDQYVLMTLQTLTALLTGEQPQRKENQ